MRTESSEGKVGFPLPVVPISCKSPPPQAHCQFSSKPHPLIGICSDRLP